MPPVPMTTLPPVAPPLLLPPVAATPPAMPPAPDPPVPVGLSPPVLDSAAASRALSACSPLQPTASPATETSASRLLSESDRRIVNEEVRTLIVGPAVTGFTLLLHVDGRRDELAAGRGVGRRERDRPAQRGPGVRRHVRRVADGRRVVRVSALAGVGRLKHQGFRQRGVVLDADGHVVLGRANRQIPMRPVVGLGPGGL